MARRQFYLAVCLIAFGSASVYSHATLPDQPRIRPFEEGLDLHEPVSSEGVVIEAEELPPYGPPAETLVAGLPAPTRGLL